MVRATGPSVVLWSPDGFECYSPAGRRWLERDRWLGRGPPRERYALPRQQERGSCRRCHGSPADPDGRGHPGYELRAACVTALRREHRAKDGDAEDTAEFADGVVGAGGDAL